jgi:hypothetical protein
MKNMGCGMAISSAISWFFDNVEQGIILEDDCLPHPDFFGYCQELLEKYKGNEQVMHIGGNNFQGGISRGDASFYFSAFTHIWGWATWRDTWKKYQYDLSHITMEDFEKAIGLYFDDPAIIRCWRRIFIQTQKLAIDTWDYQHTFGVWLNHGLSIVPGKNLVSNVGFRQDAVHTPCKVAGLSDVKTAPILPLKYPDSISQNKTADVYFSKKFKYRRTLFKVLKTPARELFYFLNRLLKKVLVNVFWLINMTSIAFKFICCLPPSPLVCA